MAKDLLDGPDTRSGFRRIVLLLIWLVILPTVVLLALGILMMVFDGSDLNLVFGILVVTLVGVLVTGVVLVLVFVSREASLSKLQSDFVSKVSHELRTPLTSIRLFVETLQMKRVTSPGEVDACLDVLNRETSRLTARIERLLDWGRMESGKRVYDKQTESAEAVIRAAIQAFDANHVGRAEPVQVTLEANLPNIHVDRGAIVDALVNLLSNAYKYTDEEGRDIRLTARVEDRYVRIAVTDNGAGIARSEHRRIFDKFYRSNELLTNKIQGSGLGLAIVRHVVQAHRGRVELESEIGKGSTFTMVLPIEDQAQRSLQTPTAEVAE